MGTVPRLPTTTLAQAPPPPPLTLATGVKEMLRIAAAHRGPQLERILPDIVCGGKCLLLSRPWHRLRRRAGAAHRAGRAAGAAAGAAGIHAGHARSSQRVSRRSKVTGSKHILAG